MPFESVDHTGDVAIRLWAEDFPALAAEGIRALAGLIFEGEPAAGTPVREIAFRASGVDREDALVQCLSEALHRMEESDLRPDSVHVQLIAGEAIALAVALRGREADGVQLRRVEEIKAVTYHGVQLRETERGLETLVILDV